MSLLVQTESLAKRYGDFAALENCTLSVTRGEVFGLLGPNGAGKTTLMRLLLGYLRPSAGTAKIDNLDCYADSVAVHRRLSYLPGDVRLFRTMRGEELLRFFAEARGNRDLQRSRQMAKRLDLDITRRVGFMSTGMRQKLALAAALAADVPLLMLDEPTSNLDPNVRGEVAALVSEAKANGRTVIFSSHVMSEVEAVCDRVVILRRGKLVHTQIMHDLRRQHRIRATLTAALPEIPAAIAQQIKIHPGANGEVTIDTPGELSPLLGWLATLPLAEVTIEPVGLQVVYDQFHAEGSA